MLTYIEAEELYVEGLNSGIDEVTDFVMTAMQNAVDQCGKLDGYVSEEQSEVFQSTLKMGLDSKDVSETLLRWFATRNFRS